MNGIMKVNFDKPMKKRKAVIINKSLQFKFGLYSLLVFIVAAFGVWREIYNNITRTLLLDPNMEAEVGVLIGQLNSIVMVKIALMMLLTWVLTIMVAQRLVGPLYNIEKSMKIFRSGNLTHLIRLRKKDQFKEFCAVINDAFQMIREKISEDREKVGAVQKKLSKIESKVTGQAKKDLVQVKTDLKSITRQFRV